MVCVKLILKVARMKRIVVYCNTQLCIFHDVFYELYLIFFHHNVVKEMLNCVIYVKRFKSRHLVHNYVFQECRIIIRLTVKGLDC